MKIRNVAIVAHVDHGKTTLVDRLLQDTVIAPHYALAERALDSNDLERERGITILSKATAVEFQGYRINIVDTPGHADFGGEVERVLSMVDGFLLVVDAVEGPMPQTRFVTKKAFEAGLHPIVAINKIDRSSSRVDAVQEEVFDLFDELGASEEQHDFTTVYVSATQGVSGLSLDHLESSMTPLLETLIDKVPSPRTFSGPFQMQISTLDYSPYVGVIGIGRVRRGTICSRAEILAVSPNGRSRTGQILAIHANRGLDRVELPKAVTGDIVCITGIADISVSETLCQLKHPDPLPQLQVDEPTLTMMFSVNTSPFLGRAGKFVSSRQLRGRLLTEAQHNVALRVVPQSTSDSSEVSGRGELHLSILIETMRREGFELAVSRPTVIYKEVKGHIAEPFETVAFDIVAQHQGSLMNVLGDRRGVVREVTPASAGRIKLVVLIATRFLLGFRAEFATLTSGTGVMTYSSAGYRPRIDRSEPGRSRGALISNVHGLAVAYALFNLQNRGRLFIEPGTEVYPGMVVGIHSRGNDLPVNPTKTKKLTNIRAAGSDENIILTPPMKLTLESAIATVGLDELVEVTPNAIRIHKKEFRR